MLDCFFSFLFRFSRDIRNVIEQAEVVGIKQMILTGNTLQMSQSAVLQAKAHPRVLYASVGVHPHFTTKEWSEKTAKEIEELAKDPVVVSIGEVGLDFHRNYSDEKAQIDAFTKQVIPSLNFNCFLLFFFSVWIKVSVVFKQTKSSYSFFQVKSGIYIYMWPSRSTCRITAVNKFRELTALAFSHRTSCSPLCMWSSLIWMNGPFFVDTVAMQ